MSDERDEWNSADVDAKQREDAQSFQDEDERHEPEGRPRPRLAIIVSAILVLALVGTSLAFLVPPTGAPPAPAAESALPTAPPLDMSQFEQPDPADLLVAVGVYSSTEVIVEVGDGAVLRGDFVRLYQPGTDTDPELLLNQLIQIELVIQRAATEGVAADAAAIAAQIEEIKVSQAGGDEAQFLAFLDQIQVGSEPNLRRLLERDQIVEQMILKYTTLEQARARHILIARDLPPPVAGEGAEATPDEAAEAATAANDAALQAEAEELLRQIEGGADFAALAQEHSDDPGSGAEGGDLGWAPRGLFVPPFEEAIFSMAVGERRLVETDYGFHIIELLEGPALRSLDDPGLLQSMPGQMAFAETFIPWIESLQAEAEASQRIKILVPATELVTSPAGS
ncbi:MAG: peptidylprolyl isomerase [Candidatus Viridilinea halotolerans]|uniref:Peptidylprolyl isomerase n=1 Tax=Candidatus Viridilinea halotolerans TaxID=2491704 RepID=A0A426U1K5_9CHLR|nr:MAG: peptidylprolyl isomerase [Candidatus Viridilinea halotolerans]